jgi:hypothetical protein
MKVYLFFLDIETKKEIHEIKIKKENHLDYAKYNKQVKTPNIT